MLDTPKYSPIKYLTLAVSKAVPEPITLSLGNPETFATTYVIISTGLLAITNIPLNPLFTTFSVISLIIFAFV